VGQYRFTVDIAAPIEAVFGLWTDLDRAREWIGGLSRVTDVTGPPDQVGTRYTSWFGSMRSETEILEAEHPRHLRTRFGSWLLRGETRVTFAPVPTTGGTRLTQEFVTEGVIPAISARIFATGSWNGSFRGELATFARIAEREASASAYVGGSP
jgi:uncharacterized protein YndB with AHSA1/START domain